MGSSIISSTSFALSSSPGGLVLLDFGARQFLRLPLASLLTWEIKPDNPISFPPRAGENRCCPSICPFNRPFSFALFICPLTFVIPFDYKISDELKFPRPMSAPMQLNFRIKTRLTSCRCRFPTGKVKIRVKRPSDGALCMLGVQYFDFSSCMPFCDFPLSPFLLPFCQRSYRPAKNI